MEDFVKILHKSTVNVINTNDKNIREKNEALISYLEQAPTKNQILSLALGNIEFTEFLKNVFERQNWIIFVIPKEYSIITTDAPVVEDYSNIQESIKSFPTANKIIPISSNIVLYVAHKGSKIKYINVQNKDQIKGLNTVIYINRNRFIYSKDKATNRRSENNY